MSGHQVYVYGVIAPSTLIELADDYPPAAGYAEIAAIHPSIGGEAAGSAYVLARLGIRTRLAGSRLGADDESGRVVDRLSAAGVDCAAIRRVGDGPPAREVVISSGDTRTVFGTYGRFLSDRPWDAANEADVRSAQIVCLDPFFEQASEQVARWCRDSGTPYVTVDVAPDSEIAAHAAVLIISEEFAGRALGTDPRDVLTAYTARGDGRVILTQGSGRVLSATGGEAPVEQATFPVEVRDTTGAGDGFRAGIIYGMLSGLDAAQTIRTASAVAAMVCRRAPGVLGSPTEAELQAFLAAHG